ncbi:holo-ACP synthase [Evansella cellulosilytica]|uniref:Holo-[acyl-carrier-protein] synthase n=1 Tax=Evansella cellulosilytica (strain ATCC 21833 / DSM 2522 / FERM P-1141 / JCM 9156 / N-4) TaxID=649639 RepID=E6TV39_EVAC2|nr:holo-ACP synthase [Evansella cellulosilytica]ADU28622.1 holo-acyl-carrier-protein synthase [Evansella cellulosilytica DSM 2522]
MIVGTGLDLVEMDRIHALYQRKPAFARRVLTPVELERFNQLSEKRAIEYLAGRFSAKEAFSKALGIGIGKQLSFQDVSIMNDIKGKPIVITEKISNMKIHLTITHTRCYAAAQVIVEEK